MKCCGLYCKQTWNKVKTRIIKNKDVIEFAKKWECKICGCVKKIIYKQYDLKLQKEIVKETHVSKREISNYKNLELQSEVMTQTGSVEYNFVLNYFDNGEELPCRESFSKIKSNPKYKPISYEEENEHKFFRPAS